MTAPRTLELKRRIADSSTTVDQRLDAVTERIDQVENESSGNFVLMKEFIFDCFRTAKMESTKGLTTLGTDLRAEMAKGFTAVRAEMADGLGGVSGRLDRVEGALGRVESKLDRVLTTRPARSRPSKRRP